MSSPPRPVTNPSSDLRSAQAAVWSERLADEVEARIARRAPARSSARPGSRRRARSTWATCARSSRRTSSPRRCARAATTSCTCTRGTTTTACARCPRASIRRSSSTSACRSPRVPDPWDPDAGSYAEHWMGEFTAALRELGHRDARGAPVRALPGRRLQRRDPPRDGRARADLRHARRAADVGPPRHAGRGSPARVLPLQAVLRDVRARRHAGHRVGRRGRDVPLPPRARRHDVARRRRRRSAASSCGRSTGRCAGRYEGVAFEPAGEDHHAPTGSFTVGSTLVREVFGGEPPNSAVYSFVSLAGHGRQDVGLGRAARRSPRRRCAILEPAIVRWLYIRRLPSQSFAIDLSAKGVQKLYDEWDRFVARARRAGRDARPTRRCTGSPCRRRPARSRRRGGASRSGCSQRQPTSRRATASRSAGSSRSTSTSRSPSVGELLAELEPRLRCAIAYVELLPAEQRTTVRASFDARDLGRARRGHPRGRRRRSPREMGDAWTLDGLTALVYAIPKVMLGLPRDADARTRRSRSRSARSSRRSTSCSAPRTPVRACRRSCCRSARTAPRELLLGGAS